MNYFKSEAQILQGLEVEWNLIVIQNNADLIVDHV